MATCFHLDLLSFFFFSCLESTTQLQDHVNGRPCRNIIRLQCIVIGQLFATKNQFDLIHLNALFFLQSLFDRQDLIFRFKIKGLFTTRQCFNKNLRDKVGGR